MFDARSDRDNADARYRVRRSALGDAARQRLWVVARRLRYGVLLDELSEAFAVGRTEDRPGVRDRRCAWWPRRRAGRGDHSARPGIWIAGRGRGSRDAGTIVIPAASRLQL